VLFGVMSVGSEKIALLSPGRTGRDSRPLKVGESVDNNWQVAEINDKSVVVVAANGTRQTVILNDPTAQVPRSMEKTGNGAPGAANVINATSSVAAGTPANTNTPTSTSPETQPRQPAGADGYMNTPFGRVKINP